MLNQILDDAFQQMDETLSALKDELKTIRTGKASISMLDGIMVDYYGTKTPLNQMANLMTPDATLITIKPYDTSAIKDIEKAILKADLGLNPSNDGEIIRVPVPSLSKERREMLSKKVKNISEEGKTTIRQIRREAKKEVEKLERENEISEDQKYRSIDEIQEETDKHTQKIEELCEKKEEELMGE